MARAVSARDRERKRIEKAKLHNYYDYSLLILVIFIVAFGLIMIYSSSSYTAQVSKAYNNDAAHFLKRQAIAAMFGIVAMVVISRINYRILLKNLPVIKIRLVTFMYIVAMFLQFVVLLVGSEINGAKRWIIIGPLNFQPSEYSKVALILFVAYTIYRIPQALNKFSGFLRIMILASPVIGLVLKENMSTAIVLFLIVTGMCFTASRKKGYYFISLAAGAAVLMGIVFFGDAFRKERIQIWLDVENHPKGFQILQGLYAIASGGLFGTGLGQSMQKLGFIPESYNDMIFSIICEEMGLFGAIVVITLFILLLWRIFMIASNAPDLFGGLICVGVLVHIAVQVLINIAVVTNSIPSTGIPLPFISYGGTSIAILLAEMGLVLSVSNQIKGY